MAASTLTNWGKCEEKDCKTHNAPRCASNLCLFCCMKEHDTWLGHVMADGKPSRASIHTIEAARRGSTTTPDSRLPAKYAETPVTPPPPREPEPGKSEELEEGPILVSTPDNSYIGDRGGKSGFPIKYVR